jgi:hypothetical protein
MKLKSTQMNPGHKSKSDVRVRLIRYKTETRIIMPYYSSRSADASSDRNFCEVNTCKWYLKGFHQIFRICEGQQRQNDKLCMY